MAHPVCLRLCTEELYIVSEHWWRRFLLSQERAMADDKKGLTVPVRLDVKSPHRSTGTNEHLEPRKEQRTAASNGAR